MDSEMAPPRSIRNCTDDFAFVCPKLWDKLQPTIDEGIRFCDACRKNVYYCRTDEEFTRRARDGQCVARETSSDSECVEITIGQPKGPDGLTPFGAEEEEPPPGACPTCGKPVPAGRLDCGRHLRP